MILTNMKDSGCEGKTLEIAEQLFAEGDAEAMNKLSCDAGAA